MSKFGVYSFCVCVVCLFFVLTPVLAQEQPAIPQQVLDWQTAAQSSVTQNNTALAVEYYRKIQQAYPDTDYAADAQKQVVLTYLQKNHPDNALTSLSEFTQKYSSRPGYIYQMGEIINRMADTNLASQAKEACQSLLERFPDNPDMMGVLQRKARCEVMMKEPRLAEATIQVMRQKYTDHPQYASAMNWAAYEYRRAGFYPQAMELYNYILSLKPTEDIQMRCRAGLALICLEQGDTANTLQAVEEAKNRIPSCKNYSQVSELEEIINKLTDISQTALAQDICESLLKQFPDDPQTLGLMQRKARNELWMKKPNLANATVEVMRQKYVSHPDYANAMSWAAYEYRGAGFYPQAMELYNTVLSLKPAEEIQMRCIEGILQIYAHWGDDAKVQEKVDYLLSNFKDDPAGVASCILGIGEEYYLAGQKTGNDDLFYKSIALLKDIPLATNKDKQFAASVQYILGLNYQYLGEYLKAASAFEDAYAADSKFEYADYCLFSVGHCHEKLLEKNLVSKAEGRAFIRHIYTQFLQIYPNSKGTPYVREWLKNNPE